MFLFIVSSAILTLVIVNLIYDKVFRGWSKVDAVDRKAVMVTGCDSGLGLEMVKHLHRLGFVTIGTCISTQSTGYKELNELGNRCNVVMMDFTKEDQIQRAAREVKEYLKKMDIEGLYGLVNNAAIIFMAEFDWLTYNQTKDIMNINYTGPVLLTKLLLPDLIRSSGRLVFVSSIGSLIPFPSCTIYCTTKTALEAFAEGLQTEVSRFGVKVIVLRPGVFSRLTKIASPLAKSFISMWDSFDEFQKSIYGNYFHRYTQLFQNLSLGEKLSFGSFEESSLHSDIEEALTSTHPRSVMVIASSRVYFTIKFLSYLPRAWKISCFTAIQSWVRHYYIHRSDF